MLHSCELTKRKHIIHETFILKSIIEQKLTVTPENQANLR